MSMRDAEFQPRLKEMTERDLGKTVRGFLDDQETEDILRNPDGGLWTFGKGKFVQHGYMDDSQAFDIVRNVAAWNDSEINESRPILETILPLEHSPRFEAAVAPIVAQPIFAIRKRAMGVHALDEYRSSGVLTSKDDPLNRIPARGSFAQSVRGLDHAAIIESAVKSRKNILVAGRVGSGKTTLVNTIIRKIGEICPNDRLVLIEDTLELQCSVRNHVALLAVGAFEMQVCLTMTMRLKPTRIIVGEVRNKEALALILAWNTGHPGGVGTIHAEDAVGALIRLQMLVAMATSAPMQKIIAETIDLVIVIDQEPRLPAGRKVREIAVVKGYENGRYVVESV